MVLSRDDLELTRRDAAIPALAVLLDDEAAAEVIRQAAPQIGVRTVTGRYLRYKPGTSLLAAYLADTPAGSQYIHVTAYRHDAGDKLGKHPRPASRAAGERGGVGQPVVDAARSLIVWPFPADDEIAALPALAATGCAHDLWRRLKLYEDPGHAPTWKIARYKPQRRLVAVGHDKTGPCGVLRLYAPASYSRSRRAAKSLGRLADDALPRVLSHSHRHAALLMSWQPGATLHGLLQTADRGVVESAFFHAGRTLARLHTQSAGKLPMRHVAAEAAALSQSAADLGRLCPDLRVVAGRVADCCVELLNTGTAPPALLHGDLHLGQIVVHADVARLIDLDGASVGDAALDLGNLYAHLYGDAADVGRDPSRDELWTALLAGYSEIALPPRRRLAAWTAAGLLRLAHEPFRRRAPAWQEATAAMIDRALCELQELPQSGPSRMWPGRRRRPAGGRDAALNRLGEDDSLGFAAAALDLAEADAHVSPLVRQSLRDDSWRIVNLRLARHKPARRCLVEYCYRNARGAETGVFGKVHAKPRHQRSLALQNELLARRFAEDAGDGISVPAAVGVVPQWQMWLQQSVAGVDGWQALGGPDAPRVARQVSDAVVKLQQSGLTPKRIHTITDELDILAERYERLGRLRPEWRERLATLLARCRQIVTRLPDLPLAPAHRDFYPDQLRVAGQRMWVLDHDLCCLADVHLDVGNFVGHLQEFALREMSRRQSLRPVVEALVHRFLERQPAATPAGVEIWTTLTLARHVSISTQFRTRRHATESILAECERRIAQLERTSALANTYTCKEQRASYTVARGHRRMR